MSSVFQLMWLASSLIKCISKQPLFIFIKDKNLKAPKFIERTYTWKDDNTNLRSLLV